MSDLCKCGHAEDHHFTPRLGGRCFRHECECVAFEAPAADRDDLAAIRQMLVGHQIESINMSHVDCTCGWTNEPTPKPGEAALFRDFLNHVAQMVLESDWLRGVRAKELRDAADDLRPKASVKNVLKARLAPMRMAAIWDCAEWIAYRADRVDTEDGEN